MARELIWCDDFATDGPPDPRWWAHELGYKRNREWQYYTDRPENVRVEGGALVIEARREQLPISAEQAKRRADGHPVEERLAHYTSGSLTTRGRFDFRYGRLEARARLPRGRGVWPAIWMSGANVGEVGWPMCGEIDVMEYVGFDPDAVHAAVHTKSGNHVWGGHQSARLPLAGLGERACTFALDWSPERIAVSAEGQTYFVYDRPADDPLAWPFDQPFFLRVNLAIGGIWGGKHGVDDAIFPQTFAIEWIRVYDAG